MNSDKVRTRSGSFRKFNASSTNRTTSLRTEQSNPHQSPQMTDEPAQRRTDKWNRIPLALVVLATCAYCAITYLLMAATMAVDQITGYLFCCNLPIFGVWILQLVRRNERSYLVGLAAAGMQCSITAAWIFIMLGDCHVNWFVAGGMILGITLLAGISWVFAPKAHVE